MGKGSEMYLGSIFFTGYGKTSFLCSFEREKSVRNGRKTRMLHGSQPPSVARVCSGPRTAQGAPGSPRVPASARVRFGTKADWRIPICSVLGNTPPSNPALLELT